MRRWPCVGILVLLLAGCGGSKDAAAPAGPKPQLNPPQAAEPVGGPKVTDELDGRIVKVGAKPEGVAVDPESGVAAVAVQSPNRLVLVDMATGGIRSEVPLPGSARHVQLAKPGGPFIVGAETANQLVTVSVNGAKRVTPVGNHPHDATQSGDRTYTADEFGGTMSIVRDGRQVGRVAVDAQPGGVAAVGDKVAIISVRAYTVELFPAGEDEPRGEGAQNAGLGPSHVVVGPEGRLAIADTRGKALIVYDTQPRLKFRARIPLGGTPVGLAADPGRGIAWVALSEKAAVVPVDLRPDKPTEGDPVETVRDPFSVGVDTKTGTLAVASRSDGTLHIVEP